MTDVKPRIYGRKTAARPFDIIHDIPQSLSLAQSLLKGQKAPICTSGTLHMTLSGTNGLKLSINSQTSRFLKIF